jgi:hypothetical protein
VAGTIGLKLAIFVAAILALWVVVLRETWRAWQPARWLLAGRYADARLAAQRLQRSWMRVFGSIRLSSRYAVGCALHLEGDLEGSITALAPLREERLRGNMRYAVCSIEAANLVLLDRDHARACVLLEEAGRIHRPPEDILLAAHARYSLGDLDAAERLFAAAGTERTGPGLRLGSVLLAEGRRQQEAIFHALRGLYLAKVGRPTEAQRDLELAARSPVTNVYAERARVVLQAKTTDTDDPRSSLAPQVLAKEIARD